MLRLDDPAPDSREFGYLRAAIESGELVVLPTDTIYGIAALATDEEACRQLYTVKQREPGKPIAVLLPDLDQLVDAIPGLSLRARIACEALLPGPWTLLLRNPEHSLPWLCGNEPGRIGVRVPAGAMPLPPLAATSANLSGQAEVEMLSMLPDEIAAHVACAIDRGPLPSGNASTVVDLTSWEEGGEPRIIRDPADRGAEALQRLERVGRAGL